MIWFKYTSLTTEEIFEKLTYISEEPFPGIIFIFSSILLIIILVNYIFPIILFSTEHYKKEYTKNKNKILIKKIALQREIEDEIEKNL
jgi:hypothetical protein